MKIGTTVKCRVLAISSNKGKDGTEYYKLSILLDDGQTGMIKVSDTIRKQFEDKALKCMDEVNLLCEYNDQYSDFRAIAAYGVK